MNEPNGNISKPEAKPLPYPDAQTETSIIQLPEIEDGAALSSEELVEPAELITGLLHIGSKGVIGGGSKSFKTWILLLMGVSVSQGKEFWGKLTNPAKVLFINFEIQREFFAKRLRAITKSLNLRLRPGDLEIWNLRGYCADWTFIRAFQLIL